MTKITLAFFIVFTSISLSLSSLHAFASVKCEGAFEACVHQLQSRWATAGAEYCDEVKVQCESQEKLNPANVPRAPITEPKRGIYYSSTPGKGLSRSALEERKLELLEAQKKLSRPGFSSEMHDKVGFKAVVTLSEALEIQIKRDIEETRKTMKGEHTHPPKDKLFGSIERGVAHSVACSGKNENGETRAFALSRQVIDLQSKVSVKLSDQAFKSASASPVVQGCLQQLIVARQIYETACKDRESERVRDLLSQADEALRSGWAKCTNLLTDVQTEIAQIEAKLNSDPAYVLSRGFAHTGDAKVGPSSANSAGP